MRHRCPSVGAAHWRLPYILSTDRERPNGADPGTESEGDPHHSYDLGIHADMLSYRRRSRRNTRGSSSYGLASVFLTAIHPHPRFPTSFCRDIICQVVAARLEGDEILTSAYAHELPRYGIKHGLTNFSAAYCVGLLCARRHLTKLGLHELYKGVEEVNGEMYEIEEDDDKRPFTALLDIGLVRTTTGKKVFAVMKGAVDGGMNIPHNEKRFPAYTKEEGFDPEELKSRILGVHVSEYMNYLLEEDEDAYKKQFANYIKDGIDPDGIEDLYLEAHQKIREDPEFKKKDKPQVEHNSSWRMVKLTYDQRKQAVKDKLAAHIAAQAAAAE